MTSKQKTNKCINLIIFTAILALLTFAFGYISRIEITWLRLVLNCLSNIVLGCTAFVFIKLSGMKPDYGFRNAKSYIIGIVIALLLQLVIGVIPALLGNSLVGSHRDFVLWNFIFQFFYYILIIGPSEELIFRVYIQDTLIELLPKRKWLGVLLASALFGFWHLINGNIIQVLFTFLIGCAFGFSKFYIKNCKYAGVAAAHGLYDFLNVVTTVFIVK